VTAIRAVCKVQTEISYHPTMKTKLFSRAGAGITGLRGRFESRVARFRGWYSGLDRVGRTRFLVLFISLVLIGDYLMFCYHTDKNIFNIFPPIPRLDTRSDISIYVPDKDARELMKESRKIQVPDGKDVYAGMLYRMVARGSIFDNTSHIVPVKTFVRHVWIGETECVIDIDFHAAKDRIESVPGSDLAFQKALEKTITENIPGISTVRVLLNGVPRKLW